MDVFPIWSIVLPTHNREETLRHAIRSVIYQTQSNFELLIVGDGCTDGSGELVKSFNDPRIEWLDLPKAPHYGYANRNIAFKKCRGELIAFMAHDDIWLPDHLAILEREFVDESIDIAYSRPVWVTPEGMLFPTIFNLEDPECLAKFLSLETNQIPAGNFAHRRKCFASVGYWNDSLTNRGDQEMWVRIIKSKDKPNFRFVPSVTNLHFRAIWKTDGNEGPKDLKLWRELFQVFKHLPAETTVLIPEGSLEQEVIIRKIETDIQQYPSKLRRDLAVLLDMRAWYQTEQAIRQKSELRELEKLRSKVSEHVKVKEELKEMVEKYRKKESDIAFLKSKLALTAKQPK